MDSGDGEALALLRDAGRSNAYDIPDFFLGNHLRSLR
jgi:hypothetical protein